MTVKHRWIRIATFVFGVVTLGGLATLLQSVHESIHQDNTCGMTFMWRRINMIPIVVPNNPVKSYNLFRYHEGDPSGIFFSTPSTIPVLFVPGSGGSAYQVRSIASVMQNKTDLRALPYRFHFYSIDFDEEFTFLSGRTVKRQRDFVIKAITAVLDVYKDSQHPLSKLVLIGHSFGGSIVISLANDNFPGRSAIDLILTKAAPVNSPPVMMDSSMKSFYATMSTSLDNNVEKELEEPPMVSWSGGIKDYQVSDRLSKFDANSTLGFYFPLWTLDDVQVDADHLCLLWCNQFVRHESRLLQAYGENWIAKDARISARDVVGKFYSRQLAIVKDISSPLSPLHTRRIRPLLWPFDSETHEFTSKDAQENIQYFSVSLETPESVLSVELNWHGPRCKGPTEVYFQFANGLRRHATIPKKGKKMTFNVPQTLSISEPLQGRLAVKSSSDCNFNAKFLNNFFWSIYMTFLVHTSSLPYVLLDASLYLASISLGLDRQLSHSTILIFTNAVLALHLSSAFAMGTGFRFITLHLRVFIIYFVIAFAVVEPIRRAFSAIFSPISRLQWSKKVIWFCLSTGMLLNAHICLGLILIGLSLRSKSSPNLIGGIFCAVIAISIGLAGGVRDAFTTTPLGVYLQEHLLVLPFWTCFLILICLFFQIPKRLLDVNERVWLLLPISALLFTMNSESVPLETYACFMAFWMYLVTAVTNLPKHSKENVSNRPSQWNDKYKKL